MTAGAEARQFLVQQRERELLRQLVQQGTETFKGSAAGAALPASPTAFTGTSVPAVTVTAPYAGEHVELTGTAVTIAGGGSDLIDIVDTIVSQHGFTTISAAGDTLSGWPRNAPGTIDVDVRYTDGYTGGGTVVFQVAGVADGAPWDDSGPWNRWAGSRSFVAATGDAVACTVTPADAAAHTADVTVRVTLHDPLRSIQRDLEGPPWDDARAWFDTSRETGYNDGDSPTTWVDHTGNGYDGTVSGPTYRTNVVNGLPVLRSLGGTQQVTFPSGMVSGLTEAEIFLIVKVVDETPTAIDPNGLWEFGSDTLSDHFPFTDDVIYDGFGSTARKTTVDPTPTLETFVIYNVTSTSSEWTNRLDGTQLYTTGTNTVGWTSTPRLMRNTAGASSYSCKGDYAEMVLFATARTASQRSDIFDYFSAKYGITVA